MEQVFRQQVHILYSSVVIADGVFATLLNFIRRFLLSDSLIAFCQLKISARWNHTNHLNRNGFRPQWRRPRVYDRTHLESFHRRVASLRTTLLAHVPNTCARFNDSKPKIFYVRFDVRKVLRFSNKVAKKTKTFKCRYRCDCKFFFSFHVV